MRMTNSRQQAIEKWLSAVSSRISHSLLYLARKAHKKPLLTIELARLIEKTLNTMSLQTVINDHRIHPRAPLLTPVTAVLGDALRIELLAENISVSGIMLSATQEQFNRLLNRDNPPGINIQPELHIYFTIDTHNSAKVNVEAFCRAIYVRRLSQNKYYVGLKYLQLSDTAATAIQQYVQTHR